MVTASALHGAAFMAANVRVSQPRTRSRRVSAAAQTVAEAEVKVTKPAAAEPKDGKAKIYVGKGRYIEDDPSKFPDRTPLTGGFAGGEVRMRLDVVHSRCSRSRWPHKT